MQQIYVKNNNNNNNNAYSFRGIFFVVEQQKKSAGQFKARKSFEKQNRNCIVSIKHLQKPKK